MAHSIRPTSPQQTLHPSFEDDLDLDALLDECLENLASAKLEKDQDQLQNTTTNTPPSQSQQPTPNVPYTNLADQMMGNLPQGLEQLFQGISNQGPQGIEHMMGNLPQDLEQLLQGISSQGPQAIEHMIKLYQTDPNLARTQITETLQFFVQIGFNFPKEIIDKSLEATGFQPKEISLLREKEEIVIDFILAIMGSASKQPELTKFLTSLPQTDIFSILDNPPQLPPEFREPFEEFKKNVHQQIESKYFLKKEESKTQSSSVKTPLPSSVLSNEPENDSELDALLDECLEDLANAKLEKDEDQLQSSNASPPSSSSLPKPPAPSVPYPDMFSDQMMQQLIENQKNMIRQKQRQMQEDQINLYKTDPNAVRGRIMQEIATDCSKETFTNFWSKQPGFLDSLKKENSTPDELYQKVMKEKNSLMSQVLEFAGFQGEQINSLLQEKEIEIEIEMATVDSLSKQPELIEFIILPKSDFQQAPPKPMGPFLSEPPAALLGPFKENFLRYIENKYFPKNN